jgi:hypothetical protein
VGTRRRPAPKWRQRVDYETVRANAELIVPRTVVIDDAVGAHPSPQVAILGAGLDGRAWRMPELPGAAVLEVYRPASQQARSTSRPAGQPARQARPRRGPIRQPAHVRARGLPPRAVGRGAGRRRAPRRPGHDLNLRGRRAIPDRSGGGRYVTALAACSAPNSRRIVNFQTPQDSSPVGACSRPELVALFATPCASAYVP